MRRTYPELVDDLPAPVAYDARTGRSGVRCVDERALERHVRRQLRVVRRPRVVSAPPSSNNKQSLITADGGFDPFNEQYHEQESYILFFAEILLAIGIKLFTTNIKLIFS